MKVLSRRTMLRGIGTAMGLPLLDAMVPLRAFGEQSALSKNPIRTAFLMTPNGVVYDAWKPPAGPQLVLSETLKPLEKVKNEVLVISGLCHDKARAHSDGPGDHARANAVFLTGAHPVKTDGKDIKVGMSFDQIIAEKYGQYNRLPSLELGTERGGQAGNCDSGYSCAYSSNVSWRTPSTPNPHETNPRAVFTRMFGDPKKAMDQFARSRQAMYDRSIIDLVLDDARGLRGRLGGADQQKVDEYLEAVRSIEKQIQAIEKSGWKGPPPQVNLPDAAPHDIGQHIRLLLDLMIVAFQTETTRVSTFSFANEGSNRTFPTLDIKEGHHTISHHGRNGDKMTMIKKIDNFYVQQFAYFVEKLKATKDGPRTLLDNSIIVYGSAISDGDAHNHERLPILLAGRGAGSIVPGRHLDVKSEVPMCNLFLAIGERLGFRLGQFGDSNGSLQGLS